MSMHDASQLVNVYHHPLSFSTSATSTFPTHVLIGVYLRRIPPLFVGDGIIPTRVATSDISRIS